MIRRVRSILGGWPEPRAYSPARHRGAFDKAYWLVRAYYAATLFITYQEMTTLSKLMQTAGDFAPLWPIFWATDINSTGLILMLGLVVASLLAIALPDRRWPKGLVFLAFLSASAFRSSFGLGSINHGNHYWIWTAFCFSFLPSGDQRTLRRSAACRYRYLLVFSYTQGLILLFYNMSGFWKVAAGIEALILGKVGTFHPEALATIAAAKMIQTDRETLFGPWLAENPLVGWPIYMLIVYVELVAILVWLRPRLHPVFGLTLASFHFGTFMLLGISFPKHVLILTLLLVWSPFIPDRMTFSEMLASLPGMGLFLRRHHRRRPSSNLSGKEAADLTRPGGAA